MISLLSTLGRLRSGAVALGCLALVSSSFGQASVTTYHNDMARTGLNPNETILKPSVISPQSFGLLFSLPVDGQVYAQPLYLPSVNILGKGVHNVVYVCTQHNSVYAFDADSNSGANSQPLWHVNFGPSVPNWETGSDDINPEVGITSTPVIAQPDTTSPSVALYVVSKVRTTDKSGNPIYTQALHALDPASGKEMLNGPVVIQGSLPGTGDASVKGVITFNPLIQHCRAALLYVPPSASSLPSSVPQALKLPPKLTKSGTIYVAFASHGDNGPYHGWLFAYDSSSLNRMAIVNTTPNGKTDPSGYPIAAGGIWQGGAGPASDGQSIFFSTGNGVFDPKTGSFGDSIVRIQSRGTSILDYFAPYNQLNLDDYDADLGSGGLMLLPRAVGSNANPNLLVHAGKEGTIYLLNQANLGKNGTTDKIVAELTYAIGGIWGAPAYFNGSVYFGPIYSPLVSIPIRNANFVNYLTQYGPDWFNYPGPTPSISSNGTTNGIVWAIQADGYANGSPAILHAYDANVLGTRLYSSDATQGRDTLGGAVKFAVPTIANGKVFVGTAGSVGVFGLGQWVATPTISPATGSYDSAITVTLSDATPGAQMYYTLDGTVPTQSSTLYKGPFRLSLSATLQVKAFAAGYGPSAIQSANYLISPIIGSGTGLTGNYFANSQDPSGTPTVIRNDSLINFFWNGSPPVTGVGGSNWAGEWKGFVQPYTTGRYTFTTNSDDGVRVWVNGVLVIDNYTYHAPTLDSGSISLTAGVKYSIDIKFFQGGGGSVLQLFWSTLGLSQRFVPTSQLYPVKN